MFRVQPYMTLLQIIELNPQSEEVFRQYEEELGSCLLCHNLFDSLENIAQMYRLDIEQIFCRIQALSQPTKG